MASCPRGFCAMSRVGIAVGNDHAKRAQWLSALHNDAKTTLVYVEESCMFNFRMLVRGTTPQVMLR